MTEGRERGRRKSRSDRAARRKERLSGTGGPAVPAYITRKIPFYELVNEEGLAHIESISDRLLAEVGMEVRDDPIALKLLRDAGADVTGHRVRFDPGLAKSLCSTAPSTFVQRARNSERDVLIGGDSIVMAPAYGSPFVRDLEGGRRYATLEDFENFAKLAYMIPWLHHSGGTLCEPTDVPVNKRHLDMVAAHLKLSDKGFMGSVTAPERAVDSIDLARVVFGADVVDKECVILGNCNVNSPLVWDNTMTGALRAYAEANQAPVVVPFILGGAMGPVTNAGAIAQAHAEVMVGVAIGQLTRKGSPVIYGNFLSSMALRSGSPTFGTPEPAIGSMVVGQLARRLGLPLRCSGAFTSSKVPDGQAMMESAVSMQAAIHCGANFLLHSAGWLEGGLSMGYEKFIMDADFCGALHTYTKGVDLSEDQFALDGFAEVGPGNHFFGAQHTLRHYETAFWDSWTADNDSFETWRDNGEKRVEERAAERVKGMLADYVPPPMDAGIEAELDDFVGRRKADMPDLWY